MSNKKDYEKPILVIQLLNLDVLTESGVKWLDDWNQYFEEEV